MKRSSRKPLRHSLHSLSQDEGEGALSEEELFIDKHASQTEYETPAATSIGNRDERDEEHERLNRKNEGRDRDSNGHAERMHGLDKKRLLESLCSSLPVSETEKKVAVRHFQTLNLDQFGNQKAVRKVALALVRYVVDQRRLKHDADWENLLRNDEQYHEVKADVLNEEKGFMKLCQKVKEAVEEQKTSVGGTGSNPGPDPNLRNTGN